MASTLPPPSSQDRMVFIPPTKRSRTASGKSATFTPTRNGGPTRSVYGDQILNVQVTVAAVLAREEFDTSVRASRHMSAIWKLRAEVK